MTLYAQKPTCDQNSNTCTCTWIMSEKISAITGGHYWIYRKGCGREGEGRGGEGRGGGGSRAEGKGMVER